jgi:membrane protein required for colicin V production
MLLVNIVLVLILCAFVTNGARNGVIRALGQLIGSVLGYLAAKAWFGILADILHSFLPGSMGTARFIAFLFLFLVVDQIIGFLFGLADKVFKILTWLPFISSINGFLGAVIGFFEGVVFVGGSAYLVRTTAIEPHLVTWLASSQVAQYAERVFYRLLGFLL